MQNYIINYYHAFLYLIHCPVLELRRQGVGQAVRTFIAPASTWIPRVILFDRVPSGGSHTSGTSRPHIHVVGPRAR